MQLPLKTFNYNFNNINKYHELVTPCVVLKPLSLFVVILDLIVPFKSSLVEYKASLLESWFVFWTKHSWRDRTSLMCRQMVTIKATIRCLL